MEQLFAGGETSAPGLAWFRESTPQEESRSCSASVNAGTVTWIRHPGGLSLSEAIERNVGTWDSDENGEAANGRTMRARVRKRSPGAEQPVLVVKSRKRDGAK